MIDLTEQITLAQIAFALSVIAFVLVLNIFGKKRNDDSRPRRK